LRHCNSRNILQSQGLVQSSLEDSIQVETTKRTKPAGPNSVSKNDGESATFWRSPVLTGVDFFKATFSDHVYSRHTHSEYAIGVTERGAQVFNCQGAARLSPPSSFSLIDPEEPHDGRSATGKDYTYRVMYVDPDALSRLIDRNGVGMLSSSQFPLFLSPIVEDPTLAADYLRLHQTAASSAAADGVRAGADRAFRASWVKSLRGLATERLITASF
jgi:hypothetical protein